MAQESPLKPEALPWLLPHLERLERLVGSGRLPHALLLSGPKGVGKRRLALALVQQELCAEGRRCGSCRDCRLLLSGSHPDLLELAPKEGGITIDQIRAALEWLLRKAPRGRTLLLRQSERLQPAAANALLKTLEEPPPGAQFLLLSDASPARLPVTVRSRCHLLRIPPPPLREAVSWLKEEGIEEKTARLAAVRWRGPLAALAWAREASGRRRAFWEALSAWRRGELPLPELSERWEAHLEEVALELLGWLRDRMAGDRRFHPDLPAPPGEEAAPGRRAQEVMALLAEREGHLQRRLLLESLLLQIFA